MASIGSAGKLSGGMAGYIDSGAPSDAVRNAEAADDVDEAAAAAAAAALRFKPRAMSERP